MIIGPEFTSKAFSQWSIKHEIEVIYILPGCPTQNAFIERFNRTCREEVLDMNIFSLLKEAQQVTKKWIPSYNNERPHSSFKGLPPVEFAKTRSENKSDGENVFFLGGLNLGGAS